MSNCLGCKKKLGLWEGYSDSNGEFCKDCYSKKEGISKKVESKKEKKRNSKQNKKEIDLRGVVFAIILLIVIFGWNTFSNNNNEYERCIDSCVYNNEFCAGDFLEDVYGIKYMTERDYDSCFYDLKYCVQDCEK